MGLGQIFNMDIVTNASPIRGGVIRAIDLNTLSFAACCFAGNLNKMGGVGSCLSQGAVLAGPGNIEVS